MSLRRGMLSVVFAVSCTSAWGCGGEQGAGAGATADSIAPSPSGPAAASMAAPNLVVQMTGLLLVVPPATGTGDVQILLPKEEDHVAWLGFGMGSDAANYSSALCDTTRPHAAHAVKEGICYVDLTKWEVGALGTGGVGSEVKNLLPPELVSVTELSGGHHRANPAADGRRAKVLLSAGAPGDTCKLARWTLRPYGGTARDQELINRLDWRIPNAPSRLVFTSATGSHTVTLPGPDNNGHVYILLAHVPRADLSSLPPTGSTGGVSTGGNASHFAAFYDLLDDPTTPSTIDPPGTDRRRTPVLIRGRTQRCPVLMTKPAPEPALDSVALPDGQRQPRSLSKRYRSLTTYGCVLTQAEPI